jgi:hypothetical protein
LKDQNVELMQKLEVKAMDEKELQKKFEYDKKELHDTMKP